MPASNRTDFEAEEFRPQFDSDDGVTWSSETKTGAMDAEELANHLVTLFLERVETQLGRSD
jgi:hypothetical protein